MSLELEARALPSPGRGSETWRRTDYGRWDALFSGASSRVEASWEIDPGLIKAGVTVEPLRAAAQRSPELLKPFLELETGPDFRKLEAANLAGFGDGVFLHVPAGARCDVPISISFAHCAGACFPRVLALVESGAEATVVERHEGVGGGVSAAFSRIVVHESGRLKWFYTQSLPMDAVHFWRQRIDLGREARLEHHSLLLGAALHKSELDVRLAGKGASSSLAGIVLGTGRQNFDPRTVQWHCAPRTSSDLLFRTALKEKARSIYTGLIRIEKEAVGSEAYQQNNNLLLSGGARADSTPVLEILTDEVRCKHGATVGPVSPDELFYLTSRGVDPKDAERMLVLGFMEPVLGKFPLPSLRESLTRSIAERLSS